LLRQVQIEGLQFLQGFRLNEKKLIEEVKESAKKFICEGMTFDLAKPKDDYFDIHVAYAAVLDFSRIQRGRKQYAFDTGDMNKCVADVVEMMRPYATQKGFSIETELGTLEQSTFDRDAVTQIVVNLLDNAIKYARDAEDKTIIVRTSSDDGFTLIEVEDHGPGVPNRQRKKIFEQFYRSEAEATRETNGTGLGLTLVKKFAEAHNGFVEITNAKPAGAIFRVALARS